MVNDNMLAISLLVVAQALATAAHHGKRFRPFQFDRACRLNMSPTTVLSFVFGITASTISLDAEIAVRNICATQE